MAGAIKPILNGIYVCDDVVGNPVGGKPMIVNLFDSVRVPVGGGFPHTHAKFCVFAWLRGGRGRARFRIEIVSSATRERVGNPRVFDHEFTNPNRSAYGRFMLAGIEFPAAGRYTVEFFCDNEFLGDQVVQVIGPESANEAS
jgi:hypothetical protein